MPTKLLVDFIEYYLSKNGYTSQNVGHVKYQTRVYGRSMRDVEPDFYDSIKTAINNCFAALGEENTKNIEPEDILLEITL